MQLTRPLVLPTVNGLRWVWRWANLAALPLLLLGWAVIIDYGYRGDGIGYWQSDLRNLYAISSHPSPYSPAFHQLIAPLTALSWTAFYAIWTGAMIAAGAWLVGPLGMALLITIPNPVRDDILTANIHVFLALAIVLALRYPAAWAVPLLTKVTPGIGALWHLARGEWRAAGIAAAATIGIIAVSAVFMPAAWIEWGRVLVWASDDYPQRTAMLTMVPLGVRLLGAAVIVVWAARRDQAWAVPIAVLLALPAVWWAGLAIPILAIPRLIRRRSSASPT